ncbi:MAG: hypothetical protein ACLTAI_14925 [Thomasclavelia sp.]
MDKLEIIVKALDDKLSKGYCCNRHATGKSCFMIHLLSVQPDNERLMNAT